MELPPRVGIFPTPRGTWPFLPSSLPVSAGVGLFPTSLLTLSFGLYARGGGGVFPNPTPELHLDLRLDLLFAFLPPRAYQGLVFLQPPISSGMFAS